MLRKLQRKTASSSVHPDVPVQIKEGGAVHQRDLRRGRQRDSSSRSNGTRSEHSLQRCDMRPCPASVRGIHVCSERHSASTTSAASPPVASLRLFTTSNSVTLRPPRLGRRLQRLWWPASLRSRTVSPNCQDVALRDLDFLLCIHSFQGHS